MAIDITVPQLGESIVEATVGTWRKHAGDAVSAGEAVVELETDKVNLEVSAPQDGTLTEILKPEGETVTIGETLGRLDLSPSPSPTRGGEPDLSPSPSPTRGGEPEGKVVGAEADVSEEGARATPLARRLAADHGIDLAGVKGSGPGGRVTHEDVTAMIATAPNGAGALAGALTGAPAGAQAGMRTAAAAPAQAATARSGRTTPGTSAGGAAGDGAPATSVAANAAPPTQGSAPAVAAAPAAAATPAAPVAERAAQAAGREERVRMSRRRQTIARRLVEAQHTAAMLTTFNEVDMSAIMELRKRRRDQFRERHGVGLGFMSFFTRAVVGALKAYPRLNAELRGDEMILKHYYDIGIAVSTDEGLVVPVVRDADRLTFAEIERQIATLAEKARNRSLSLEDLQGGTFTITNGGVFGSLLSTPILNGPQVGILGMHKIQERPIAVAGQVVIHPMMYVAVSYDHRIVDGAESVSFLVRVKELLEDPEALLLEG